MNPFAFLKDHWPWNQTDWQPDWDPEIPIVSDHEDCARDREHADAIECQPDQRRVVFPVEDLESEAAGTKYPNGKVKRTRYRRVNLSKRIVLIVLHQTGAERSEFRTQARGRLTTCHRLIGPTGTRYRVHPLNRRLVAANKLDRKPFHAISIEMAGNFEGDDGEGNWYRPDVFGRGRAGEAQLEGGRQEVMAITQEVEALGGRVVAIAPHRVSGRNRKGKPNRPICCGSRVWSLVGELAAAEYGLRVPGNAQTFGGLEIPDSWHGEYWTEILRLGLKGIW